MAGINLNVSAAEIDSAVLDHKNSTIAATKSYVNTTGFTDTSLTNMQLVASKVDQNNTSLNTLNNQYELLQYYNVIEAGTSGTVEIPTGYTIELDRFAQGVDAIITKQGVDSRPFDEAAYDASGNIITTTIDISGNYSFSGTPAAYPVCIVYYLKGKRQYRDNIVFNKLLDSVEWVVNRKSGSFNLDFGTYGNLAEVTVTDSDIHTNSVVTFMPIENANYNSTELALINPAIVMTNVVNGVSFDVCGYTDLAVSGNLGYKYIIEN